MTAQSTASHYRRIGPYVLTQKLGEGGFAPVWLAKEMFGDTELRSAAVKIFDLDKLGGRSPSRNAATVEAYRAQVTEEARTLCRIEHPNVVRFYSMISDVEHNVIALAMEYVAGESVDNVLERCVTLPIDRTFDVGIAVASALAAVHKSGLVHRDVKPANVIDASGVYKLIDFGIAATATQKERTEVREIVIDDLPITLVGSQMSQLPDGPASHSTYSDLPAGTIGYMDPETVATGARAVPSSDLYSLGAMLFECLTGKVPAATGTAPGFSGEILDGRGRPPSLASVTPSVPRRLGTLVDKLLAPRRAERPKSAEWVARELERLRSESLQRPRQLPDEEVGPFRSLDRYERGDRDVYFGRTTELAGALELLRSRGFVAVVGPSGSGKSSLARAGVIPAVSEGALGHWPPSWSVLVVVPGLDPRGAITAALSTIVPDASSLSPDELVFRLGEHVQSTGQGVFLLVDQLEELATLAAGPSQAWAVELLVRLGEQTLPGVRTLATARQDLLDSLLRIHQLGRTLGRGALLVVTPLTDSAWLDVVDQALQTYGYALEDDALRDELHEQLRGTATAMPLVQFALHQLWMLRDRERKLITRAALKQIGGIAGALERYAEAQLAQFEETSREALETARRVLIELTTAQGTRATLSESEIVRRVPMPLTHAVLERLEHARLFVREQEGITLAHEALLSHWRRLQWWIADVREARERIEDLERDATRWASMPDEIPLLPRPRVRNLDSLLRSGEHELSAHAVAYLKASRTAANRARKLWGAAIGTTLTLATLATFLYTTKLKSVIDGQQELLAEVAALRSQQGSVETLIARANEAIARQDLASATSELNAATSKAAEIRQGLDKAANAVGAKPTPPASIARPVAGPASAPSSPTPKALDSAPLVTASPEPSVSELRVADTTMAPPAPAPNPALPPPPSGPRSADPREYGTQFASIAGVVAGSCLSGAYARTHRLVSVTLTIGMNASGSVDSVTPRGIPNVYTVDDRVLQCLQDAIRQRFRYRETPPPGFSFPFELTYSGP